jgi:alanine racemase
MFAAAPEGAVTWAEIDLDAIQYNVRAFKRHIDPLAQVIGVVKANAYGHGAAPVAQAAVAAGASMLAVHRVGEGVALRQAWVDAPVLVMGYTPPSGAALAAEWRLTPSVTTLEFAQALAAQASARGRVIPVHVKVDTGMGRYGLLPDEVVEFLRALQGIARQSAGGFGGIAIEGLFTHFATADWADQTQALAQWQVFNEVRTAVEQAGIRIPLVHAANSAAAMTLPQSHLDAVRPGIGIYGLRPSNEWAPPFEIRPALALKSMVARVRQLPAGAGIGYGRTHVTQQATTVALLPAGYGDGYHRSLSNKGVVLVRGQRAPVVGRVSMDQIVIDISHIPGVKLGDEAVLIGRQGAGHISAEEVAELAGTINYEVTTGLLPRVARVFIQGGRPVPQ